ncbi:MAG: hypothetical protein ACRDAM_11315, partial [Casimicrobium sp.]
FGLSVQTVLGDTDNLEVGIRSLIARWESLAGEKSDRIDRLLYTLANHYQFVGQGQKSAQTFRTLVDRTKEKGFSEATERLQPNLGLLETQALFNLDAPEAILTEAERIAHTVVTEGSADSPRFRQHLLRAAIVALTYGRLDEARRYVALAKERGRDNAPSSAIRELQVESQLARAQGDHRRALSLLDERVRSFESRGEAKSRRRALVELSRSYELWLTGERSKDKLLASLDSAQRALPISAATTDLFRLQHAWLRSLFEEGEASIRTQAAFAEFARYFGRRTDQMPRIITGLYFL